MTRQSLLAIALVVAGRIYGRVNRIAPNEQTGADTDHK